MAVRFLGGSFAPPITAEQVAEYRELAKSAELPVRDAITELATMVEVFLETPTTDGPNLPEAEVKRIWDYVPWDHECEALKPLFETLPTGPLRNAAFHLLWYAVELTQDREPATTDRYPAVSV